MLVPDVARDVAERFDAGAALDILLISLAIYWLLLRGTTAWTVLLDGPLPLLNASKRGTCAPRSTRTGWPPEEAGEAAVRVAAPDGVTVREWRPARLSVTLAPARDEG